MNTHRLFALVVLLGAATFTGCVIPVSEKPVVELSEAKIDERLLGAWEAVSDRDQKDIFSLDKVEGKPTALLIKKAPADPDSSTSPDIFLYAGKVGDMAVLNAQVVQKSGTVEGNIILRYELNQAGDEVHCRYMATPFIAEAIQNGEIAGTLEYKEPAPGEDPAPKKLSKVKLTASTAELSAFIAKHGEKCFQPQAEGSKFRRPEPRDQP